MSKSIMFQGTSSGVGKSLITCAFCRIFYNDGYKVFPFKSQNMALNSYITKDGLEMGRAQVCQAEAAKIEPEVRMNPILLKPCADKKAQVILNGKVVKNADAIEYHEYKPKLKQIIKDIYVEISSENDVVLIEGAGSPVEINLRDKDLVNMGMAEISDSPVILIADIDRGGVFASIVGTMTLFTPKERERVKGVIINKFRGDVKILQSGLDMLEDIIKVPVLGVIPHTNLNIEDEDSLTEKFNVEKSNEKGEINIEIIQLPHMSNFTDFDVFATQKDVNIRYVKKGQSITNPDMLIIPGTKNTTQDLIYLRESGIEKQIHEFAKSGKLIFGICGGYQILGKKIYDPENIESSIGELEGLSLINIETTFEGEKVTTQVKATICENQSKYFKNLKGQQINGYEIHMGRSTLIEKQNYFDVINEKLGSKVNINEGAINNNVVGTYMHGVFDNIDFTRKLLNNIRMIKGLDLLENVSTSFDEFKDLEYEKLAEVVKQNVDMEKVYKILNDSEK